MTSSLTPPLPCVFRLAVPFLVTAELVDATRHKSSGCPINSGTKPESAGSPGEALWVGESREQEAGSRKRQKQLLPFIEVPRERTETEIEVRELAEEANAVMVKDSVHHWQRSWDARHDAVHEDIQENGK